MPCPTNYAQMPKIHPKIRAILEQPESESREFALRVEWARLSAQSEIQQMRGAKNKRSDHDTPPADQQHSEKADDGQTAYAEDNNAHDQNDHQEEQEGDDNNQEQQEQQEGQEDNNDNDQEEEKEQQQQQEGNNNKNHQEDPEGHNDQAEDDKLVPISDFFDEESTPDRVQDEDTDDTMEDSNAEPESEITDNDIEKKPAAKPTLDRNSSKEMQKFEKERQDTCEYRTIMRSIIKSACMKNGFYKAIL
jgi:hypothetical protein